MKIAVITDTHFGVRNDHVAMLDHAEKFYNNIFFPELEKRKIDTIWHLGDLVDRRKFINYNSLVGMKEMFIDKLSDFKEVHFIVGNHDMYFKHNMTPNAIEELLGPGIETGRYKNFHLHSTPTVVDNITVIPWICNQTKEEAYRLIHSNSSRFLFGHLQISGFEMDRGRFAEEGEEITGFTKYDAVLTGHFHHKSSYGSIHYLGSPYEMTWKDFDDPKGFHIFDTETSQLEYIENPYKIFIKLVYDDDAHNLDQLIESVTSCSNIKNAYAKVIIKNKNNTFWYDTFIDKITESGISDLQIVEDHYNLNISPDDDIICQAEDTLTILTKYIGTIDVNVDTFKLDQLLRELHEEAGLMRV